MLYNSSFTLTLTTKKTQSQRHRLYCLRWSPQQVLYLPQDFFCCCITCIKNLENSVRFSHLNEDLLDCQIICLYSQQCVHHSCNIEKPFIHDSTEIKLKILKPQYNYQQITLSSMLSVYSDHLLQSHLLEQPSREELSCRGKDKTIAYLRPVFRDQETKYIGHSV